MIKIPIQITNRKSIMIKPDTELTLRNGTRIRILSILGRGGEGVALLAENRRNGQRGVYKVILDNSSDRRTRTQFLVKKRLVDVSPLFCAPIDYCDNGHLGHFSPFAPGMLLEQYLENPGNSYFEIYKLAIALCQGYTLLNGERMTQGDPSLRNAMIFLSDAGAILFLIDFDNFRAPNVPLPTAFGQEDRMAPELRKAYQNAQLAHPDERSDWYALTTIIHEMILAKSVASGFDNTTRDFNRAMSGGWPHDPLLGKAPDIVGGYPAEILNAELAAMFRSGLSANPDGRLSASKMTEILSRNFSMIWVDPRCHGPSFIDPSKTHCPHCKKPFPTFQFVFPRLRKTIVCDSVPIRIGRGDLNSPYVSELHGIIRKCGQETRLQSLGKNGTYRWNGTAWQSLNEEAILQAGDRLRFADIECLVEEINN